MSVSITTEKILRRELVAKVLGSKKLNGILKYHSNKFKKQLLLPRVGEIKGENLELSEP